MTYTVKQHDQQYLNLKIGEDLPDKTQVLPLQNTKRTTKTVKKHYQPYLILKIERFT